MTKILDVVSLKTGYASEVDVRAEFRDADKNRRRVEAYRPIAGHRTVLGRLSRSLYPNDKRCYMLSGTYGTGKSHLVLMFTNYLYNDSNQPEMKKFFENYSQVDNGEAEKLRSLRSRGRYMVAICDYASRDDFEEIVLKAIDEACIRDNFHGNLDTHYEEAVRRLKKWEKDEGTGRLPLIAAFREVLADSFPQFTYDGLKKGLRERRSEFLRAFKETHREILGMDFTYDKSNLRAILEDFLSNPKFHHRYEGLAVLFDEFGYTLDKGRISPNVFQDFAQMCAQTPSGCKPCLFLATGHKSLSDYAQNWSSRKDFAKVEDRIEEIALTPEGIEDIIGAIVMPDLGHPEWKAKIEPRAGSFRRLAADCKRLNLFDWLSANELDEQIIRGIYPMHPMATFCLLKLANDVGSRHRSVFRFFSGGSMVSFGVDDYQEGSYPWFISQNSILDDDGQLQMFTSDLLSDYFEHELSTNNADLRGHIRRIVQDYEETVRALNGYLASQPNSDESAMTRIIDTMLVYQVVGLHNSVDNLAFGLECSTRQQLKLLEAGLKKLAAANVIYLNPVSNLYEFKRSDAFDFDRAISEYKDDPKNVPTDLANIVETLIALRSDQFVEAKEYNQAYQEDKRFLRRFALVEDLASDEFFDRMIREMDGEKNWAHRYEGVAVHVICEEDSQLTAARQHVKNNPSNRILVVVPTKPIPISDSVQSMMATKQIANSAEAANFTTQDQARLAELMGDTTKGYTQRFVDMRRDYLSGREAIWYGQAGCRIASTPKIEHGPISAACEMLFPKRSKFSHDDFNLRHKVKYLPSKNYALKDAVERVLNNREPIRINRSYGGDKGEIRYLWRLAQIKVLKQQSSEGSVFEFEVQHDISAFASSLLALGDMINDIRELGEDEHLLINDFVAKYTSPPYGLGPIGLALSFSCLLRLFSDSIQLKREDSALGYMKVLEHETLVSLLDGEYPKAYLRHRAITQEEKSLLNELHRVFSSEYGSASKQWTISDVADALSYWWHSLSSISKAKAMFSKDDRARALIDLMEAHEETDIYSFIFERLQTVYGYERDDAVTSSLVKSVTTGLIEDQAKLEDILEAVRGRVISQVGPIFDARGSTYEDISAGIRAWYNDLDVSQRDELAPWHTNESKALLKHLRAIESLEVTLTKTLPSSPNIGLGEVKQWQHDKTDDYIAKIAAGKREIDDHRIKVATPIWEVEGTLLEQSEERIIYRGKMSIEVHVPSDASLVYLTSNGEDPRDDGAQRVVIKSDYSLAVKTNKTLKLVAMNSQGEFSRVAEVFFINDDTKHQIDLTHHDLFDEIVSFVFPVDLSGFRTTLNSLLHAAEAKGFSSSAEIADLLRNLADGLEGGDDG